MKGGALVRWSIWGPEGDMAHTRMYPRLYVQVYMRARYLLHSARRREP